MSDVSIAGIMGTVRFYALLATVSCTLALFCGLLLSGLLARILPHGPGGAPRLLQPFYDLRKLLGKESLIPSGANRTAFVLMPMFALAAALTVTVILAGNLLLQNGVPIAAGHRMVGDLFLVMILSCVPAAAMALGAAASGNPLSAAACGRQVRILSAVFPLSVMLLAILTLNAAAQRRFNLELTRQVNRVVAEDSALRQSLNDRAPALTVPLSVTAPMLALGEVSGNLPAAAAERARQVLHREIIARRLDAAVADSEIRAVYGSVDGPALHAALSGEGFARWGARVALVLCLAVSMLCALALMGLPPFDAATDRRLAGGLLLEYGGSLLAIWKLVGAVMLFAMPLLVGMLCLGGFRLVPGAGGAPENLEFWRVLLAPAKYLLVVIAFGILGRNLQTFRPRSIVGVMFGPVSLVAAAALLLAVLIYWNGAGC